MKSTSITLIVILVLTEMVGRVSTSSAQEAENQQALTKQSDIVFAGTVTRLSATSFSEVPKSADTVVVRVDSVVKKPASVSLTKGNDVTVEVKNVKAFHEGTMVMFYAVGWLFGSGIAVKEIGHEVLLNQLSATAASEKLRKQISGQDLQERVSTADVIVLGRVTDVHPLADDTAGPAKPISEHDPDWQEAVIQVESTVKGNEAKKVVVRFPASQDIAWFKSPKLSKGQEATFLLKLDSITGSPTRPSIAGVLVIAYTALKPGDVLPPSSAAQIRSLLRP
jgi:hypothetical protein